MAAMELARDAVLTCPVVGAFVLDAKYGVALGAYHNGVGLVTMSIAVLLACPRSMLNVLLPSGF